MRSRSPVLTAPARIPFLLLWVLVLAFAVLAPGVAAQDVPEDGSEAAPAAPAANPLEVRQEIYVVSQVTKDDGTKEERFTVAESAFPGQIVEYRLFVTNVSETTLPAGIVKIIGPVPQGMAFVADSATPTSERVLTEFSGDGGLAFTKPPVLVGTGDDRTVIPPEEYDSVRWTLLVPMEPGDEEPFFYRVIVQ